MLNKILLEPEYVLQFREILRRISFFPWRTLFDILRRSVFTWCHTCECSVNTWDSNIVVVPLLLPAACCAFKGKKGEQFHFSNFILIREKWHWVGNFQGLPTTSSHEYKLVSLTNHIIFSLNRQRKEEKCLEWKWLVLLLLLCVD